MEWVLGQHWEEGDGQDVPVDRHEAPHVLLDSRRRQIPHKHPRLRPPDGLWQTLWGLGGKCIRGTAVSQGFYKCKEIWIVISAAF